MSASDPSTKGDSKEPPIKCRYVMILMGFAAGFFFYAHRITMSVGIVAMVNNSALTSPEQETAVSKSCQHLMKNASHLESRSFELEDGEFLWEPRLQGYILGSSFLCYALATAPAGKMTGSAGCKKILFWGTFYSSVLTLLTPLAAWCGIYVIIFVQSLRGAAQAGVVPAQSVLIANWCPKLERGLSFTIMITGSSWGALVGSYVAGLLCQSSTYGGWPSAFYVIGGAGIIVSLLMGYFMHDNPRVHPTISKEEFEYIINNQENTLTQKRPKPPWGKMFSSVPVYALSFAYFGQVWSLSHFLTVHPTYLGTILHYSMAQNGLFSALPFLLQIIMSLLAGWLSTYFNKKNYMSVDVARKFWNFMSCFGYSVSLLGIYFAGCNRRLSIMFSVLSLSSTGFAYAGCWIASTDMSPTFAGSVNAVACLFGVTSNFILPVVVGFITNGMQTMEQWNKILFISIGVVMSSGIVFAIFGSAKVQPWNYVQEKPSELKAEIGSCKKKPVTVKTVNGK